jgi:serine phosphatase RsbU (regulator of sigma subunit)
MQNRYARAIGKIGFWLATWGLQPLLALQENIGINSAFEIELVHNGLIVARSGRIASQKKREVHWWLRKAFPIPSDGHSEIELLIRVSSFSYPYKGIMLPPKIGSWSNLERETHLNQMAIIAGMAVLVCLCVYHLILYLYRRDDNTNLVFSLTCLAMSLRMMSTGRLIESMFPGGYELYAAVNYRILYATMIWCVLLLFKYMSLIISNFFLGWEKHRKLFLYPSYLLGVLPFLAPDYPRLHEWVYVFEGYDVVACLTAFILLVVHARRHLTHSFEARITLACFVLFVLALVNDIGYAHYLWNSVNLMPYCLMILFIVQSLLLARKYRKAYVMQTNLKESQAVQEAFLPDVYRFPNMQAASFYRVAGEQAGGDLFDFKYDSVSERCYAFIGDVTGHGISSALVTGAASGAINGALELCRNLDLSMEDTLHQLVRALNKAVLVAGYKANRLMTMALIGIDLRNGRGIYVNAGHNEVYIASQNRVKALLRGSAPLGLRDEASFSPIGFHLNPGDRIFLYTDGLIENRGYQGDLPKIRRIKRLLVAENDVDSAVKSIQSYCSTVWRTIPPEDDATFLILKWTPETYSQISQVCELR